MDDMALKGTYLHTANILRFVFIITLSYILYLRSTLVNGNTTEIAYVRCYNTLISMRYFEK